MTVGQFVKYAFFAVWPAYLTHTWSVVIVIAVICTVLLVAAFIHTVIDHWLLKVEADVEEAIRQYRST